MNVARAVTAVVGIAVAAFGLVLLFSPRLAAAVPVQTVGMSVIVLLAFGQAARVFADWVGRERDHRTVEADEAEEVPSGATPGDDFDRLLAQFGQSSDPGSQRTQRDRVQWRLREAALSALERRGYDTDTAVSMVHDGTWTDDEVAAWIFTDEDRELRAEGGWRGFLGLATNPQQSYVRGAEAACFEIAQLAGVDLAADERDDEGDDGSDRPTEPGPSGSDAVVNAAFVTADGGQPVTKSTDTAPKSEGAGAGG